MSPGWTRTAWCRRGESNRRATLNPCKLLILINARNAKTARKAFRGYAAATRNATTRFQSLKSCVRKKLFRVRRPANSPYGTFFSAKESGGRQTLLHDELGISTKNVEIIFKDVFNGPWKYPCRKRHIQPDRWPTGARGGKDCGIRETCLPGFSKHLIS